MTSRRTPIVLVALFVSLLMAGSSPKAQSASLSIKVEGDHFTINDTPAFLTFVSYFDALHATDAVWHSDLSWLHANGVSGVRVFPNWFQSYCQGTMAQAGVITPAGGVNQSRVNDLTRFLSVAAAEGVVVDVTFSRETVNAAMPIPQHQNAVASIAGQLRAFPNAIVDVQNEWSKNGFTRADIGSIVRAVKNGQLTPFATGSTEGAETDPGGFAASQQLDFVAHHEPRVADWYTDARVNAAVTLIRTGLNGAIKPIYLQEPQPVGGISCNTGGIDTPSHADVAVNAAKRFGAAAWTFHTRAAFDLNGKSLQGVLQQDPAQMNALTSLAASAGPQWGASAVIVTPPALALNPHGGSASLTVSPAGGSTAPWHVSTNVPWVHLGTTDGSGVGTVSITYDANVAAPRSGAITVAGRSVALTQGTASRTLNDFDGDGKADLAVWRQPIGSWFWIRSSDGAMGNAGLGGPGDIPVAADINGDGKTDFVTWRPSDGLWTWSNDSGVGSSLRFGGRGDVPLSGDIDGDGISDLIVWRSGGAGTFFWLTSSSRYTGGGSKQFGAQGDVPIGAADIDGDGRSDLVVWRPSTGVWFWLTSSTGYTGGGQVQWGTGALDDIPMSADIDGDGRADLVVWRPTDGTFYWLVSSESYSAQFGGHGTQWGTSALGDVPILADYDGDGKADLAVWRPLDGTFYWLQSSEGYSTQFGGHGRQWGSPAQGDLPLPHLTQRTPPRVVDDFDGDGAGELTVWRASDGFFYSSLSSGNYSPGASNTLGIQWGSAALGDVPMVGDLDGDGYADPVIWRPGGAGTFFWLQSSSQYSTQFGGFGRQFGSSSTGDQPMLADIDGDGRDDLIVWRPTNGTWFWLTSSSNYTAGGAVPWGDPSQGDVPLVGDIDGDRKADLVVWRASTGTWYWLTSSSGYAVAQFGARQWGSGALGDVPLLGDLDADGKADLVVWRPGGAGTWFWLTSTSGFNPSAAHALSFGSQSTGDVPLLGDLDGDGVADITIWRPTTGEWFWLTSVSRYTVQAPTRQFGAGSLGDKPLLRQ